MALLAPGHLDAVFAVGTRSSLDASSGEETNWIGSAFVLGVPGQPANAEGELIYYYLVTARHVVENAVKSPGVFIVRTSDEKGRVIDFAVPPAQPDGSPSFYFHPKERFDIAVAPMSYRTIQSAGAKMNVIHAKHGCWLLHEMRDTGVSEGDGIYLVGFPLGLVEDSHPRPIVRGGTIARIRDAYEDPRRTVLIDVNLFPGGSGGPVFVRPDVSSVGGTKSIKESRCLGLMTRAYTWDDVAISRQTNSPRVVFVENAGLARMEPIDRAVYVAERHLSLYLQKLSYPTTAG